MTPATPVIPELREAQYPGPRVKGEALSLGPWLPGLALSRSPGMTGGR
jgi:hypothetical protein